MGSLINRTMGSSVNRTTQTPLQIPGKVILFGEYSVLFGAPAILAALKPKFVFEEGTMLPDSGLGTGFGSSGAEWLAKQDLSGKTLSAILQAYLSFEANRSPDGSILPSGADVAVQVSGGIIQFKKREVQQLDANKNWLQKFTLWKPVQVEKERTYLNLRSEAVRDLLVVDANHSESQENQQRWTACAEQAAIAWIEQDEIGFSKCMQSIMDLASSARILTAFSNEVFHQLRKQEICFKGCGAGFHDVFLFLNLTEAQKEHCKKLGLAEIGNLSELVSADGISYG